MIGKTLGHYRITAPIGAGGMGEVYRATDTKLGRDVALKMLPAEMAADPERLERFQREARTLAALNHPNIVTIFSVEESGITRFLAMELIEGDTLDTIIAAGGLSLSRFLEISVPLADAISAAHERGIVHRDLKPGNVMVTREGRVKVLDFGLARLGGGDSGHDLSKSPTGTHADLTGEGQVFGTVAYMSPEQARGAVVDARSDVFSLGVVLYQMLTGERPFTGTTAVDIITSILRDTPPSVMDLRADLPSDVGRILRRCLEKVPRDRYQTSRDVYNELKELRAETSSVSVAPSRSAAPKPARADSDSGRTKAQAFWIALLPFTHTGADAELAAFADGLSEDINAGLAKFPYLSVLSRNLTVRSGAHAIDPRSVASQLGARYFLEGGIRKGGSALRINVQLVDAQTGANVWAETYNRELDGSNVLAVQDDVTDCVVATVADTSGALVRSMAATVEEKPDAELTASECVLRHCRYQQRGTPDEHARVRGALESFVEREPGHAEVWACLGRLYVHEFCFGFNARPEPLDRALRAAQRAVDLDPTSQHARNVIAQVYFFRREVREFRIAANHALALNPRDTDTLGVMGNMFTDTGDFERGPNLTRRAMHLNPHHPDWLRFPLMFEHFQKGDYESALEELARVNMPGFFWKPLCVATCCGLLGRQAEGAAAVQELRRLDNDIERHARDFVECWLYASGLGDRFLEGLQKAGLEIAAAGDGAKSPSGAGGASSSPSGSPRADEGFWIAVLPFKSGGGDAGLAALAGGISEEIVAGLSRFSYLRVITGASTSRYAAQAADVREVGRELGARYVLNGTLRQVGARLRVAVELVDASSGAQLWAETYERALSTEAIFELQDDLVSRIVSTVGDPHGILPFNMSESLRSKTPDQLTPYEAVLRSFGFGYRSTPEEHAAIRDGLERAVERAPEHSDGWAMVSLIYSHEFAHGFNPLPDPLGRALEAARRAAALAPSSAVASDALAWALFFRKDFPAFRMAAEQSLTLNSLSSPTLAGLGTLIAYSGEWEKGCALVERALQLNPRHPGWYRFALFADAYRKRDYRAAVNVALKINLPELFVTYEVLAAAYGQLAEHEEAHKAVRELLRLNPDYPAMGRQRLEKWYPPDLVEHFIEGLRKAGLAIPAAPA